MSITIHIFEYYPKFQLHANPHPNSNPSQL